METIKAKITIPSKELRYWGKLLRPDEGEFIYYAELGFKTCECVGRYSATFADGIVVDLKVCTGSEDGEALWCEAVFFHPNGTELSEAACTDVSDTITGEWKAEIDGKEYVLGVEEELVDLEKLSKDELLDEFAERVMEYDRLRDEELKYVKENPSADGFESGDDPAYEELHTRVDEGFCRVRECLRLIKGDPHLLQC